MSKFQLFSNNPHVPLFRWVDCTCGKGKMARDTVFISTVVLLRLINAEFHKKNWEFWRRGQLLMCIWKKSRGEDFYRRQVIDFPEWVSIKPCHCWLWNSRSPSAFVLFFLFNVSQFYNLGFVSLSQSRTGKYSFFVMDIGQHQRCALHVCAVQ